MDTHEAMMQLFNNYTLNEIAEMTGSNYYTVTSWKFKFKNHQLSLEKQIEILTKTNYKPKSQLLWKQEAK